MRRRAEASFGPGALDYPWLAVAAAASTAGPPRHRARHWLPWHRSPCVTPQVTEYLPFMPRAKRALERALREAECRGDRHIGVEHVLLGLLDPKNNAAVELLHHLGADPRVVRTRVLADLGKAA